MAQRSLRHGPLRLQLPRFVWLVTAALLLCPDGSAVPEAAAAESASLEYQVKAAMIYNFAKFVRWPDRAAGGDSLLVGLVGDDPFDGALEITLAGKRVAGKPVEVRRLKADTGCEACDLIVVGRLERSQLAEILRRARGTGALTVSDVDQFTAAGGMIGFVMRDGRVHFEVNIEAARQEGLEISSKLLRLATTGRNRRGQRQ